MAKMKDADAWATIIAGCLGALIVVLLVAILGGWLVAVSLGYLGVTITWWQGAVIAFTARFVLGFSFSSK